MDKKAMLLIYTDKAGPRLRYTLDFVFRILLPTDYSLCHDIDEFRAHQGPALAYCEDPLALAHGFSIKAQGLLSEKGIREQNIQITEHEGIKTIYRTNKRYDLPFDVFSAIFFLIVRYEEYLPHRTDGHDRYDFRDSLAFQEGMLHKPMADHYALLLGKKLQENYPELVFEERQYQFIPTIDVDHMYAYLHKGILRTLGACGRNLIQANWSALKQRWQVLRGKTTDPYDQFDWLQAQHLAVKAPAIYFFLMADYGGFDTSQSPYKETVKEKIRSTADYFQIGLHPSYRSNSNSKLIDRERNLLEDIIKRPVSISRQHYLKLKLPTTYVKLASRGFEADFSMLFAGAPGFRSGTASPHYFYDLDHEAPSTLKVYPSCVMDTSLMQYLQLSPEQAMQKIDELIAEVRLVKGTFISLWHNSSLSDEAPWLGWRKVYEHLLKSAKQ